MFEVQASRKIPDLLLVTPTHGSRSYQLPSRDWCFTKYMPSFLWSVPNFGWFACHFFFIGGMAFARYAPLHNYSERHARCAVQVLGLLCVRVIPQESARVDQESGTVWFSMALRIDFCWNDGISERFGISFVGWSSVSNFVDFVLVGETCVVHKDRVRFPRTCKLNCRFTPLNLCGSMSLSPYALRCNSGFSSLLFLLT